MVFFDELQKAVILLIYLSFLVAYLTKFTVDVV